MKLKRIASQVVRVPLDEPLASGPPYFRSHNQFVTLRIETDDGIEGIGVSFFGGALRTRIVMLSVPPRANASSSSSLHTCSDDVMRTR